MFPGILAESRKFRISEVWRTCVENCNAETSLKVFGTGKSPLGNLPGILSYHRRSIGEDEVSGRKGFAHHVNEVAVAVAELNAGFGSEGRIFVRPSGTEPLVRVMIEGNDKEQIQAEAKKLANLVEQVML